MTADIILIIFLAPFLFVMGWITLALMLHLVSWALGKVFRS